MDGIPPINELELAAKKLVWTAQKQGKLKDFTPRLIRQAIEKQYDLEEGSLDASEYKSAIKAATNYAIHNAADEDEDEESKANRKPKNKRKSDGTIKAEGSPPKQKPSPKAKAKAKAKSIAREDERSDEETPKKKRKVMPKVKEIASDDEQEDDYMDEDASPKKKSKTVKPKAKKIVSEDEDEKAPSAKPKTKQGKDSKSYKSAEHVPTSDVEQDEPDTAEAHQPVETKKQPASPTSPGRAVSVKAQPESTKSADVDMEGAAAKSESVLSVLIDEPPKRKRKKPNTENKVSTKATDKSKPKRIAKSSVALSKDEETIKRLKSLVVACGTRKVWSKVFQGLDTPQQQIKKLKEILTDLGMSGRMSMEQAKAIKEKRELEQELADVQEFAEKMEDRTSKSRDKAKTSAEIENSENEGDDSSDGEEVEAPKRRPMTARKSIMAFLGDQSDED